MGGFELGLANAGQPVEPVAFCEREPLAAAVLRARGKELGWDSGPTPAYYSSIHEIEHAEHKRDAIDIIFVKIGGGRDRELGPEFYRDRPHRRVAAEPGRGDRALALIRRLQPEWAIVEAPCDLLTAHGGAGFQSLLAAATGYVAKVGNGGWRRAGCTAPATGRGGARYGALWRVLDLRCFGAASQLCGVPLWPQCRERCYIVLRRGEAPRPEVFLDPEDLDGVLESFYDTSDAGMDEGSAMMDEADQMIPARVFSSGGIIPFDGRSGATNYSPIVPRDTLPTIHGQNVALAIEQGKQVRWLTPDECELAFTLTNGWTATGTQHTERGERSIALKDATRYRMLGRDTVPPAIIEWIGRRIFY